MKKVRIGVLASGRGSNLQAIIDNIEKGRLSAELAVVVSDQADAFALERARKHGIPAVPAGAKGFKDKREEYDALLVKELQKRSVDIVCLAGFMRIITPVLIKAFPNRILNIHPSLLPAFPGLHVQKKALDCGVKFSGCTVHFVDEGMDTGRVVLQAPVAIEPGDTVETLTRRGLAVEHEAYVRALDLLLAPTPVPSGGLR